MPASREKFATQVNSEILSAVRRTCRRGRPTVAGARGRGLLDLIEKRKKATPRAHVVGAYLASHAKYAPLYKKLAE